MNESNYSYCPPDCQGCTCFNNGPCTHCVDDHENVDNHPVCKHCSEILYEAGYVEKLKHEVKCFELE